ncbi:MAG TPA: ABC transporter ATP-binding protein, partial [Patescibacteria group bacterium]|nr:ABC transporter ATP-binding protein [Patescibacteria group bacterium]
MEEEDIVQIKDLYLNFYTYDGVVKALDGVSFGIKKGEILGLVGETGSGKSVTSLSVLSIFVPPGRLQKGQIDINIKGKTYDILSLNDATLARVRGKYVSMIFQEPRAALNPVYTVGDQISEVYFHHRKAELVDNTVAQLREDLKKASGLRRMIYKADLSLLEKMKNNPKSVSLRLSMKIPLLRRFQNRMKTEARKMIVQILKSLNIPDPTRVIDMYPHELSGGMAQRAVIAMSLACNPMMLIADEPTTSLDVTVQAQILLLIKDLQKKFHTSILYVTHDLGVVAETCDRVVVLYAGNVAEIANVFDLFKKPLHPYTQALLESIPRPGQKFVSIRGTVPSLVDPPKGCRFC